MRATYLILTVILILIPSRSFALESFNCFDTPNGEHKCACIGVAGCRELQQSGNCKSDLVCDQDQLGAIICSCNAGRTSRPTSLKRPISKAPAADEQGHDGRLAYYR